MLNAVYFLSDLQSFSSSQLSLLLDPERQLDDRTDAELRSTGLLGEDQLGRRAEGHGSDLGSTSDQHQEGERGAAEDRSLCL